MIDISLIVFIIAVSFTSGFVIWEANHIQQMNDGSHIPQAPPGVSGAYMPPTPDGKRVVVCYNETSDPICEGIQI